MSDDLVNWHYDKFKEGPEDFDDLHDKAVVEIDRLKQQLASAHRAGWEQCQREARGKLSARYERYLNSETIYILNEIECCERAIAAMEYKGESK